MNNKAFGKDLKIIVVGNAGTGKTSFVNRWTKNQFSDTYRATVVSEFGYKIFNFKDKIYKIQLWDIAGRFMKFNSGQDKTINVTKVFCKDSHGVVIVCDLTDVHSLTE